MYFRLNPNLGKRGSNRPLAHSYACSSYVWHSIKLKLLDISDQHVLHMCIKFHVPKLNTHWDRVPPHPRKPFSRKPFPRKHFPERPFPRKTISPNSFSPNSTSPNATSPNATSPIAFSPKTTLQYQFYQI